MAGLAIFLLAGCVNTQPRGGYPQQAPIYDPAAHDVGRGLSKGL
ncbi:MAG: hypothetical protein ACRECY_16235 [Phyllobacterium sp.]